MTAQGCERTAHHRSWLSFVGEYRALWSVPPAARIAVVTTPPPALAQLAQVARASWGESNLSLATSGAGVTQRQLTGSTNAYNQLPRPDPCRSGNAAGRISSLRKCHAPPQQIAEQVRVPPPHHAPCPVAFDTIAVCFCVLRQLLLHQVDLYSAIKPRELLSYAESGLSKHCPNVRPAIDAFDRCVCQRRRDPAWVVRHCASQPDQVCTNCY